jgi:hypothetical protein
LWLELQIAASSPASFRNGSGAGLPLALVALQGDGAGGLENGGRGLARGEVLRREVVDRDGGGDRVRGGAKFFRLGVVDQVLRARLADVADVRLVQAIAQRLRRDDEREGTLEARHPIIPRAAEDVGGDPLARGRRLEQNLGAGLGEPIGGTAAHEPERQQQEA